MLKLDENYSDYVDMDNPDYPEGAAKNASSSESYDGTPLLASFMNNVIGGMQAMWKKAFGSTTGITGSADTVNESQFANAVEKFVNDKVEDHADLRGKNAHGAKSSADPGQIVTRDEYGNAKFGVPLANDDAARRGDIYDLTKGVLCMTEATVFAKEIPVGKFPGFELNDEIIVKVLFQSGCEKDTSSYNSSTDIFTLNFCNTGNKKVYVKRNGAIKLFEKHNIGTKTKVFQSYTEMELMYLTSLDNGSGGWLVLNNPIVLSNTGTQEYTIYADGSTTLDAAYPVGSYYEQLPGFFSPNDKWGAISVWEAVQMGGVFFRSEGSNALPFTGALKCTVSGTTISLASDAETRGYESTLASKTATELIVVVGDQQRAVTAWNRTNHTITIASAFSSSNITNILIGECDSNKSHYHGMQHYHDRGTMNITGTLGRMYTHRAGQTVSGAFTVTNENYGGLEFSGNDTYSTYNFNASNSWTGKTSGSLANQTTGNTTTKTNTDNSGSIEAKPINVSTKLWKRVS